MRAVFIRKTYLEPFELAIDIIVLKLAGEGDEGSTRMSACYVATP